MAIQDTPVPTANPVPLGLAGFGLTTLVLSSINSGLISSSGAVSVVVPLAFAYGGVAQIIAGIMEFRNGNTFGTVAFISYGLFWWWHGLLPWTIGAGWIKAPAPDAIGVTLLAWGLFTLYMWISTFRLSATVWAIFLLLWATFFCLAAGDLGAGSHWHALAGYVGLATGIVALYASFAEVTNATFKRNLVPRGRPLFEGINVQCGTSATSSYADFGQQIFGK